MSLIAPFEPYPIDAPHQRRTAVGALPAFDHWGMPRTESVPASVDLLLHALLCDDDVLRSVLPRLQAMVDESVITWTPSMRTTTRTELVNRLLDSDNTITDMATRIEHRSVVGATTFIEWSMRGRFGNCVFLNDDVLVEPSGRPVSAVGVMVMTFRGGRATDIQCHYDRVALARQVLDS